MNVLFLSPGFPEEMKYFTHGFEHVGARVFGVGDTPRAGLDAYVKHNLADYLQIANWQDEQEVVRSVHAWVRGKTIDRVVCLWEPVMFLAAKLREALGVPGLSLEQSIPFRDKAAMKAVLAKAGLRTPRDARCTNASEVWAAAERIGYPLIIKPIAGAGSADTYRCDDKAALERAVQMTRHVPEVSVEEYIEGEELTYDTVCAGGRILFENVSWYRPKPLVARLNPWISPQSIALKNLDGPEVRVGCELGRKVIAALGFQDGMTHMEWFRTPKGEAVFGEIGGRAPGGRIVHAMNYSCDADLFAATAEAVCHGKISQNLAKRHNCAIVFKRAVGNGRIARYEGLENLLRRYGEHIPVVDLTPIGQTPRDPRQVVVGDGWIVARHPDLATTLEMADFIGTDLRVVAA
ncbi:MAG: ATP-grasp domain-containing protein [Planctomycetes bacterium]|nr:ATP-grasp domain-containing protein [Planctomycetota bacterium]